MKMIKIDNGKKIIHHHDYTNGKFTRAVMVKYSTRRVYNKPMCLIRIDGYKYDQLVNVEDVDLDREYYRENRFKELLDK